MKRLIMMVIAVLFITWQPAIAQDSEIYDLNCVYGCYGGEPSVAIQILRGTGLRQDYIIATWAKGIAIHPIENPLSSDITNGRATWTIDDTGNMISKFLPQKPKTITVDLNYYKDNKEFKYLEVTTSKSIFRIYPCGKIEKKEWKEIHPNEDNSDTGALYHDGSGNLQWIIEATGTGAFTNITADTAEGNFTELAQ